MLKIKQYIKGYGNYILALVTYGFIAYFVSISNQLTNNIDAFWQGMYWYPYSCMLEEGRFSWWVLGKMCQGLQMDAYMTIVSFGIYAIGLSIAYRLLSGHNRPGYLYFLLSCIFVSEVGVRSQLSYRYMGPYFALSFLFCMIGCLAIVEIKNNYLALISGAICFALGMGFYQVDIGCAALLLLMQLLIILFKENELKVFWKQLLRDFTAGVLGVGLYIVLLKISLAISGITLTPRLGDDGLKVSSIFLSIPNSILRCYMLFYEYFFDCEWNNNIFQNVTLFYILLLTLLAIGTIWLLYRMWNGNKKIQVVLFIVLLLFIPIFANVSCFLGFSVAISIQMMISMCFVVLVYGYMLYINIEGSKSSFLSIYKMISLITLCVLFYGAFYSLQIDQQAMYEGKNAITTMSNQMISDLTDMGYFDTPYEQRKPVAVMGSATPNEQFVVSDVFYKANRYARMGDFMYDCTRVSWESAFRFYCNRNIEFVDLTTYFKLVESEEVKNMPQFPMDGYILEKDNVIILNVSIDK